MYWIDKVIDEIKWRCGSKFDIDGIEKMVSGMKKPADEWVAVVEISAEPVEIEPVSEEVEDNLEPQNGEAEKPELPTSEEECPECGEEPCVCEDKTDTVEDADKSDIETEEASMEDVTPAEQDRMDEILKAIENHVEPQIICQDINLCQE